MSLCAPNSTECDASTPYAEDVSFGRPSASADLMSTTPDSNINSTDTSDSWADFFSTISSISNYSAGSANNGGASGGSGFGAEVMIPLYSLIFILSVVGNILVIVTLTQNRRMRTVTNVFLLNLAVADLLLGVFCMPFTLIGQLLRDFIFGNFMCKIIPYFQAVSVAVGVWTLVAISLERYFAICRPLKSRIWQTRRHAYKMICAIWVFSLSLCLPVAILSRLKPIRETGRHKCREEWPDEVSEKAYNILLDVILLVLPLLIMGLAYWLIAARLWRGLQNETGSTNNTVVATRNRRTSRLPVVAEQSTVAITVCGSTCRERDAETEPVPGPSTATVNGTVDAFPAPLVPSRDNHRRLCCQPTEMPRSRPGPPIAIQRYRSQQDWRGSPRRASSSVQITDYRQVARYGIRSTYTDKSVWAKKKVIRMLFVIVFEFFLCWTPLYVVNSWYAFDAASLYKQMGPTEISLIQLLAYLSSCCNPITYCFMNEKFRNAFLSFVGCGPQRRGFGRPNRSTDMLSASLNDSYNLGRRSFKGNSRVINTTTTDIVETVLCGEDDYALIERHPNPPAAPSATD